MQKLGEDSDVLENVNIRIVKGGDELELGRRTVQCISAATPRYPDLLCLYERGTRKLFSSCLFSAHVNPQKGVVGTDGTDEGGWEVHSSDWKYFFDCMFAPVARQTSSALQKLDLQVSRKRPAKGQTLSSWLKNLFGGGSAADAPKPGTRPVAMILPRHGPIARQSVTQLVNAYIECAPTELCKSHASAGHAHGPDATPCVPCATCRILVYYSTLYRFEVGVKQRPGSAGGLIRSWTGWRMQRWRYCMRAHTATRPAWRSASVAASPRQASAQRWSTWSKSQLTRPGRYSHRHRAS